MTSLACWACHNWYLFGGEWQCSDSHGLRPHQVLCANLALAVPSSAVAVAEQMRYSGPPTWPAILIAAIHVHLHFDQLPLPALSASFASCPPHLHLWNPAVRGARPQVASAPAICGRSFSILAIRPSSPLISSGPQHRTGNS